MSSSSSDAKMDAALAALDNWYDEALKTGGFKTEKERKDYLASLGDPEKHPMFAQSTEDLEGNPLVEALRAIKEEDKTNLELAIMYKDEGNEWIKKNDKKSYKEALQRYTHAFTFIENIKKEEEERAKELQANGESREQLDADILKRKQLESQIYSNRAQVHIYLQNYGSCKNDCDAAILCWPENIKAFFRKGKALFALRDYLSCQVTCKQGLAIDATHKELQQQLVNAQEELVKKEAKEKTVYQTVYQEKIVTFQRVYLLAQYLGCNLGTFSIQYPEPIQLNNLWPTAATLSNIPANKIATMYTMKSLPKRVLTIPLEEITFPMLFLYPQYNQLDIISEGNYTTMIAEYLAWLFPEYEDETVQPVTWDTHHEYYASNLVVYLQYDTNPSTVFTSTAAAAVAGKKPMMNKLDWLIHCFEYALYLNQITLSMFIYALNTLSQQAATMVSTTPSDYFPAYEAYMPLEEVLTNEIVLQIIRQREIRTSGSSISDEKTMATGKKAQRKILEVHVGCTIEKVVTYRPDENVLSRGTLSFITFPKTSPAHEQFLRQAKEEHILIEQLNP